MRKLLALTGALFLVCGLAVAASAQGTATNEITTAHAHAMMAQNASSVAMAHKHLHHVINCLVGPEGDGFDAAAGRPCKGMGNGALSQAEGFSPLHIKLENARMYAQAGLRADTLPKIHAKAAQAATALSNAAKRSPPAGTPGKTGRSLALRCGYTPALRTPSHAACRRSQWQANQS